MFKINELITATKAKVISLGAKSDVVGISTDSRTIKQSEVFLAVKGDNFDGHDFVRDALRRGASCVIISKNKIAALSELIKSNTKVAFLAAGNTTAALGDIANYHRNKFDIPVIAVTGSNGKTTTKEMLSWVLSLKFNVLKNEGTKNNAFGVPAALLKLKPWHDIAVLELGTNHPGEIANLTGVCRPNVGIITNIGPSHLEYFHSLEGVLREKYSLIEKLDNPRLAILNYDDKYLRSKLRAASRNNFVVGYGIDNPGDFSASNIRAYFKRLYFSVNGRQDFSLKTLGCCNIYNALAAVAAARAFGIGIKDIASRLAVFDFPKGRLKVKKVKEISFIDDTYNSNPLSLKSALDTLGDFSASGRKILVMGDMLELGKGEEQYHNQAGKDASCVCDVIITVGKLSGLAAQAAKSCGFDTGNLFACSSSGEAKEILFNKVFPGKNDIVLIKGSRRMRMEEILTVE